MRRISVARLLALLFFVFLSALVEPPWVDAGDGYSCDAMSCADAADLCTSSSGTPSFTWLGLCQDEYDYLWERYLMNCSGTLMTCTAWTPFSP